MSEVKTYYRCPICGASLEFLQKAKVINVFNHSGTLTDQRIIKLSDKIECGSCGHIDDDSMFEMPEFKVGSAIHD